MLESICGKVKNYRSARSNTDDGTSRHVQLRNQHQHQSLDGLIYSDVANERNALKSTTTPDASADELAQGRPRAPTASKAQTRSGSSPQAESASRPCSKSMTMQNLHNPSSESVKIHIESFDDSTAFSESKKSLLPRSKTATISQTITRQNATTSESASSRSFRLSAAQRHALRNTWRIIKDNSADRIAEKIFHRMVNNQPKVKDVFYKAAFLTVFSKSNSITTYRDHARLLARMINELVVHVDDCESVLKEIRQCGTRHVFLRQSGFKADVWEKFGEAAVEVINEQDCVKSNLDAVKAWTFLIASITDEMRQGFEKEARRQSYSSGRPKSACD